MPPEHGEIGFDHLAAGRKVELNLKQLGGIALILPALRKHLRMHDAPPGGHPLQVAFAEPGARPHRIGVIHKAFSRHSGGLKAPVGVLREARNPVAVVHAPTVFPAEVLADGSPVQRGLGTHVPVPPGVGVIVMGAK